MRFYFFSFIQVVLFIEILKFITSSLSIIINTSRRRRNKNIIVLEFEISLCKSIHMTKLFFHKPTKNVAKTTNLS